MVKVTTAGFGQRWTYRPAIVAGNNRIKEGTTVQRMQSLLTESSMPTVLGLRLGPGTRVFLIPGIGLEPNTVLKVVT